MSSDEIAAWIRSQRCPAPADTRDTVDAGDAADLVVLPASDANAADALRLISAAQWPVATVRGQISLYRAASPHTAIQLPRLPVAGFGYLLPDVDGLAVFGASSQPGALGFSYRISVQGCN
jgi:hypothetical protein